jgi:hypothetical protein
MSKQKQKPDVEALCTEASMVMAIYVVAIAKQAHEATGELSGEFECPRCHAGTVRWSVAPSNKHIRVCCSRTYDAGAGETFHCTQAME